MVAVVAVIELASVSVNVSEWLEFADQCDLGARRDGLAKHALCREQRLQVVNISSRAGSWNEMCKYFDQKIHQSASTNDDLNVTRT